MKYTYIYGLVDPRDDSIRYVGKSNNPKKRLYYHIKESKNKNSCHRHHWINSLLPLRPEIIILEKVSVDKWQQREIFWIDRAKEIYDNLTNNAKGGLGGDTFTMMTDEAKRLKRIKVSNTLKKNPPNLGKVLSEEFCNEQSDRITKHMQSLSKEDRSCIYGKHGQDHKNYGRTFTKKTKDRIARTKKANRNPMSKLFWVFYETGTMIELNGTKNSFCKEYNLHHRDFKSVFDGTPTRKIKNLGIVNIEDRGYCRCQ